MRAALFCVGLLSLTSCAEYQERQNDDRQAAHHEQCRSYGLEFGTPPYANCLMNLDQQDNANRQAVIGAYLTNQPRQQPYVLPMPAAPVPAPVPRACTSTVAGQTVYTNCN